MARPARSAPGAARNGAPAGSPRDSGRETGIARLDTKINTPLSGRPCLGPRFVLKRRRNAAAVRAGTYGSTLGAHPPDGTEVDERTVVGPASSTNRPARSSSRSELRIGSSAIVSRACGKCRGGPASAVVSSGSSAAAATELASTVPVATTATSRRIRFNGISSPPAAECAKGERIGSGLRKNGPKRQPFRRRPNFGVEVEVFRRPGKPSHQVIDNRAPIRSCDTIGETRTRAASGRRYTVA